MFDDVEIKMWVFLILVAAVIAIVVIGSVVLWLVDKKRGRTNAMTTQDVTYGAVSLAMAFALSLFAFVRMPQDGSITPASTVPIIIYCYFFGARKGLIISTVYMLLQLIYFPMIVSPYSALLDYIIPYSALALTGCIAFDQKQYNSVLKKKQPLILAHKRIYIGCLLYITVRYFSHVFAGVLFYADYAWKGWSVWGYSMAYNAVYCIGDFVVAMIALTALLSSKAFNTFMASNRNALQDTDSAAKDYQ